MFNRVSRGVMYTKEEVEGKCLKNLFDIVMEGVGINCIMENFKVLFDCLGMFMGVVKVSDVEVVAMSRFVARYDGFFIGSLSVVNFVFVVCVV